MNSDGKSELPKGRDAAGDRQPAESGCGRALPYRVEELLPLEFRRGENPLGGDENDRAEPA
jgi:hypothetical protein